MSQAVSKNAAAAVLQVIFSAAILFCLYYFLIRTIGAERMGLWSIVVASVSIAQVGGLGMAGGVVKFVAKYLTLGQESYAAVCLETAALTVGTVFAVLVVAAFPLFEYFLDFILPLEQTATGKQLLPYSMTAFVMTAVAGIFLSGLDGAQRIELRSLIATLCLFANLVLSILLVPKFDVFGLVYAQIAQATLLLFSSAIVLGKVLPELRVVRFRWSKLAFLEMFNYGINFQLVSIMQLFFEPVTKSLLAKFGDLSAVSYFEMANRLVLQVRSLLVSANQVLVPVLASVHETDASRVSKIYWLSIRWLLFFAIPIYASLFTLIPLISSIWLGYENTFFILTSVVLILSWFVNNLSVPAYFSNLGTGDLKWNTIGHALIGVLNLVLGFCLGIYFGAFGVVVGFALALVAGSFVISANLKVDTSRSMTLQLLRENRFLLIIAVVAPPIGWTLQSYIAVGSGKLGAFLITLSALSVLMIPVVLIHPLWMNLRLKLLG